MSNHEERPMPIKIYWPRKKSKRIDVEKYLELNKPLPILISWPPSPVPFREPVEGIGLEAETSAQEAIQKASPIGFPEEQIPTTMTEPKQIVLKREYDYVGGDIRFKVAVQNVSNTVISDINVILNPTSQYVVPERIKMINFLKPNETRGVDFMLTPLTCGKSMIYGTVTYIDPFGKPHSSTIQPKEIWVKCPLVKARTVEKDRIARLKKELQRTHGRIDITDIPKTQAFRSAREQIAALDVAEVQVDEDNLRAVFSGIAKVGGDELLVELMVGDDISVDVYTRDIKQATGFLAYIKNLITLSIEVIKKLGVKVERISEQVLNCFDINQRIVDLCNSCRCEDSTDDILLLLKELNSKNKSYFSSSPLVDAIDKWIEKIESQGDLTAPISS
ncbi:MAG: hypothetical protein ACXQS8_01740, partial [Candidatus Helarchaeales archaeon]